MSCICHRTRKHLHFYKLYATMTVSLNKLGVYKMKDYKSYKAPEQANITRQTCYLIIAIVFASIAYTSNQEYEECINTGHKSIVLCGGGNAK